MLLLHKVLPILVLPLGASLVLLTIALFRRRRLLAVISAGVLYIASTPLFGNWVLRTRERQYPAVTVANCPTADAIVVLSGTIDQNSGAPDGYVWTAADRFDYGIRLFQAGKARMMVFTGGRVPWLKQTVSEGEILQNLAVQRGVPPTATAVAGNIENTADEANALGRLARDKHFSHLILVTTAWHMPRAMLLFRYTGLDVTPFAVGELVNPSAPLTVLDFLPQAAALQHSEIALRELLGTGYYGIRRGP